VGLEKITAGILLTIGQLFDGIATIVVGVGLDRFGICGSKYGKRKSWHLLGTIIITLSFPFIFSPPIGYTRDDENWTHVKMVRFLTCVPVRSPGLRLYVKTMIFRYVITQ